VALPADDTAVSLDQRPLEHCGRAAIGPRTPLPASRLAETAVRHAILPGNQDHLLLRLSVTPFFYFYLAIFWHQSFIVIDLKTDRQLFDEF